MNAAAGMLNDGRTVFLFSKIDVEEAKAAVASLMWLDSTGSDDILLLVNCKGGGLVSAMAVHDCIQGIRSDVRTVAVGKAYSGGASILAAGTKGKRHALPNASIMFHQPRGQNNSSNRRMGAWGWEIRGDRISFGNLVSSIARDCSQPRDFVEKEWMGDGKWMTPQQAKRWGVIDSVVERIPRGEWK